MFALPHSKRSVYQLRSTRHTQKSKQTHGNYSASLFKSKPDKAAKSTRLSKKAPNRPVYCEVLDSSAASLS